jgi:hypothetical protein
VDPAEGGMCWDQSGSTLTWCPGCVLLYPSYVEVENSSLVLRQFWRLTEVPPDLDTDTLSGSGSGSFCLFEGFSTLSPYFPCLTGFPLRRRKFLFCPL